MYNKKHELDRINGILNIAEEKLNWKHGSRTTQN